MRHPPAPVITVPDDGSSTTFSQMWVAGSAEPGSAVALLDTYGYITDTVDVDGDGEWGLERGMFGGNNELYAVAENAFGPGPESNHVLVSLVPNPPLYPPTIVLPPTIKNGDEANFSALARDDDPQEGRPTVAVTATLDSDDVILSKVSSSGPVGTWEEVRPVSGLNNGDYRVLFAGEDEEGYVGEGESTLRVKDPPPPPVFTFPTEPVLRNTPTLNVSGRAQAFSTVRLYVDGALETTIELGIVESWNVPLTLDDGTHTVTADAVDDLDQVSPEATAGTITIDTVAPTASIDSLPAHQNQSTIDLGWSGQDPPPGTGVDNYDLQHRFETGSWETLLAGTSLTAWPYTGDEGAHSFRVLARDVAGNEGDYSPETTTVVDLTDPDADLVEIYETSPYAHASDTTVYYGVGGGDYTVQVHATDNLAGLDTLTFPAATAANSKVFDYDGETSVYRSRVYAFDTGDTFSGDATVEAVDRAGNEGTATFTVLRDAQAPAVNLSAVANGGAIDLTWSAVDAGSGLATCALEVQKEGESTWTALSMACSGSDVYEQVEPRVPYTFRVTATDRVSNAASAEAEAVTKYYYFGGQCVAMRTPEIFNTDQGAQFTAQAFTALLYNAADPKREGERD